MLARLLLFRPFVNNENSALRCTKTATVTVLVLLVLSSGCATAPRKRFLIGAGIGGVAGTVGGAVFSPNSESRGLNSLVFGLTGALIGGLGSLFFHDDAEIPDSPKQTKAADKAAAASDFTVQPTAKELPKFVRDRLTNVIVEELHEPDSITDDGSLHEPHKVYRIKRQAELIANPINENRVTK